MSNEAILMALKRMEYQNRMTGHGFRALAMSTSKERSLLKSRAVQFRDSSKRLNPVTYRLRQPIEIYLAGVA